MYVPKESEHTCPVMSISRQVFIAVTRGFWQITDWLLVKLQSHMAVEHKYIILNLSIHFTTK